MKINELFPRKTVLSYEVFSPRSSAPVDTIYQTLESIRTLQPDFISVTYGAGGTSNNQETFSIASTIKSYGIPGVVHLPCVGLSREAVAKILDRLNEMGIENILALRGDLPEGTVPAGAFSHASDLIAFIHSRWDFNILAACYPEGHVESPGIVADIRHLKAKVDAGANQLITQLFFDNAYFYTFRERCELAGIHVPIEAGIMPVINKKQIRRMASLCGATVPPKFAAMMDRYENHPLAMRDAGIAYAVDQIVDLITHGVDGIHLYTMNNPYIAGKIHEAIHNLI